MPLGLFPLPPQPELEALFSRLLHALAAHDYASTWSIPWPGKPWHLLREPQNLRRFLSNGNNAFECSPWAGLYRRAFAAQKPDTVRLYDAFQLGKPIARDELARLVGGDLVRDLSDRELLVPQGGDVVSRARVNGFSPIAVVSDNPSVHRHERDRFVFCGRCSSRLGEAVREHLATAPRGGRSLDLCTGSGIQALNGAASFDEVWGLDLNPRAVAFARANALANGVAHARFVESDLFANVEGTFDLITANTPFLLLDEGSNALDGYGGKYGMEVELRIYEELDSRLRPGGTSLIVASSAFVDGRNLLEDRLREIFAGKPYAIDLFPISQYYSSPHYRVYEAQNVRKCILYVVRARKDVTASLDVNVHPFGPVETVSLDVKVQLEREIGRRKYLRSQSENRA